METGILRKKFYRIEWCLISNQGSGTVISKKRRGQSSRGKESKGKSAGKDWWKNWGESRDFKLKNWSCLWWGDALA